MSAQAQIIFAISAQCSGLAFGEWLQGNGGTWLLVMEDTKAPEFPPLPDGVGATDSILWAYRLHASGSENHPTQRAAVQTFCNIQAYELPSFSHDGSGVHKLLRDLGTRTSAQGNQHSEAIKALVEGGSKATILKLADEFAAFITLAKLTGHNSEGLIIARDCLIGAAKQCPRCPELPDKASDHLPALPKIAAWCLS